MNTELLVLSMALSLLADFIQTNKSKIDAMSPEEFKALADELAAQRRKIAEMYNA